MRSSSSRVPLRWGDMDAMSHLNNRDVFRLMEEARISGSSTSACRRFRLAKRRSCARRVRLPEGHDLPGYCAGASNRDPRWPFERRDVAEIEKKGEPGVVYATGRTVIVWYDYSAGKSRPWPEKVRQPSLKSCTPQVEEEFMKKVYPSAAAAR